MNYIEVICCLVLSALVTLGSLSGLRLVSEKLDALTFPPALVQNVDSNKIQNILEGLTYENPWN